MDNGCIVAHARAIIGSRIDRDGRIRDAFLSLCLSARSLKNDNLEVSKEHENYSLEIDKQRASR